MEQMFWGSSTNIHWQYEFCNLRIQFCLPHKINGWVGLYRDCNLLCSHPRLLLLFQSHRQTDSRYQVPECLGVCVTKYCGCFIERRKPSPSSYKTNSSCSQVIDLIALLHYVDTGLYRSLSSGLEGPIIWKEAVYRPFVENKHVCLDEGFFLRGSNCIHPLFFGWWIKHKCGGVIVDTRLIHRHTLLIHNIMERIQKRLPITQQIIVWINKYIQAKVSSLLQPTTDLATGSYSYEEGVICCAADDGLVDTDPSTQD